MNSSNKFSISDFDKKLQSGSVNNLEFANEIKAVITHYLHNLDNGVAEHFKSDALKYINDFSSLKNVDGRENGNEKEIIDQLSREVLNVPFPTPTPPRGFPNASTTESSSTTLSLIVPSPDPVSTRTLKLPLPRLVT